MGQPIRVLVVDDMALYRDMLSFILNEVEDVEVVGTAEDPFDARAKIKELNPDVVTLDVEMPGMDGLTFLERIMTLRPTPVIMVSTLTGKGTETAIAALQIGAVECLAKPMEQSAESLELFAETLRDKVRMAAHARLRARTTAQPVNKSARVTGRLSASAPQLIAIGSSTGGVEAVTEVLRHLPPATPPVVIAQHMPPMFTASMANRLSTLCPLKVVEAENQQKLTPGMAVIAPGGRHLRVVRSGTGFMCRVSDDAPVNKHRPSVDVLFDSVTQAAGAQALGLILTGMGKDGAEGLLRLHQAGAHTLAQDEASCVVYGMPKAAVQLGAVSETVPLSAMADHILKRCFG